MSLSIKGINQTVFLQWILHIVFDTNSELLEKILND